MKNILILPFLLIVISVNSIFSQPKLMADIYASYFGGNRDEIGMFITIDNDGNIIIAGNTKSGNLPVKPSGLTSYGGGIQDGFIAKFNPDMSDLIFLKYLEATYVEIRNVAVDSFNNIFITGQADANFPVTNNAIYKTYNGGGFDGFLRKYEPDGNMLYSTFIGGNDYDFGSSVYILNKDEVLVLGATQSTNFPIKPGSYINKGRHDIFLMKLNLTDTSLIFSTCIGGSSFDFPKDLKVDLSGNIYISGRGSAGFPVINGFNQYYGEYGDGFITKFSKEGELIYSSKAFDGMVSIDINKEGEVYFASNYSALGLTCAQNAFYTNNIGGSDMIIGKINATGDSLLYLSYFGGTGDDNQSSIWLVENDKVITIGKTTSPDYPVSVDADKTISGTNIAVSVLDIGQKEIMYSDFIESPIIEIWHSILQNDSTVFLCATTSSGSFPVSDNAYSKDALGGTDLILARFTFKKYKPSAIQNKTTLNKIKIFPNPAQNTLQIEYPDLIHKNVSYKIIDLSGKTMRQGKLTENTIDVSKISKGSYILNLNANSKSLNQKFIIE